MIRTRNSVFNMITNLAASLLLVVLNFITRSVFIRTLGTSYLGIEGYYSNILSMLSLTELGFGSAIVFKLYKPLEENDRHRILVLLKLFRQVYQIIGLSIIVLGLCLIPFLPRLVKDYDTFSALGLNAVGIFLIYLFNNAASYWFFAYKTVFMDAKQKTYVLTVVGYAITLACSLSQILILVFFQNFTLYVAVQIVFTILKSLINARICDKYYPEINEKTQDHISREELKEFFKDCSSLLLYRINSTVMNASDNIVLTAFSGLTATGLYANYLSIKVSLRRLLASFSSSFQASLGSIYTVGNLEWSRLIFQVINFITFWLYGIGAIGMAILTDKFILLWLRDTSYIVTSWTVNNVTYATPVALLIGLELYTIGQNYYCEACRNAMGLFRQLKYRPVASIAVNLIIGVLTVPYIGIAGCVLSTIISNLTTTLIVDPIVIYKYALKQSPWPYFRKNLLYKAVTVCAGLLCWQLCELIPLEGVLGFIVCGFVCVAVPSAVFFVCFFRTRECRYLLNTVKGFLTRLRQRGNPSGADSISSSSEDGES